MSRQRTIISAFFATLLAGSTYALAQDANPHPVHETSSVSIPAKDIHFFNSGVKTEIGELEAGPAYGDLQNGHHGTFIHMPAGFVSPVHTHTEDYYAVVIKGVGANDPVGAKPKSLPIGSYWFQRGEEAHLADAFTEIEVERGGAEMRGFCLRGKLHLERNDRRPEASEQDNRQNPPGDHNSRPANISAARKKYTAT